MILNSFPHIKKSVKNIAEEMKVTFDEQDAKGVIGFEVQQYNQGTVIEVCVFIAVILKQQSILKGEEVGKGTILGFHLHYCSKNWLAA